MSMLPVIVSGSQKFIKDKAVEQIKKEANSNIKETVSNYNPFAGGKLMSEHAKVTEEWKEANNTRVCIVKDLS